VALARRFPGEGHVRGPLSVGPGSVDLGEGGNRVLAEGRYTARVSGPRRLQYLPLVPLAPAVVVVVGTLLAVIIAVLGLADLRRTSDALALEKAEVIGQVIAARLQGQPPEDREIVMETLGARTGTELMFVDQQGRVLSTTTVGARPAKSAAEMLVDDTGVTDTSTGRSMFATVELRPPYRDRTLVVLVHAPAAPAGSRELLFTVLALAAVLIAIAALVALSLSQNARDDVAFVQVRIAEMGRGDLDPVGQRVPVRTFDQVGELTSAFNVLVDRFAAAQRAYEQDLAQADVLDRSRSQFLAALSHELRTPLNAILGFADLLLAEVEGPLSDSLREDLEVIRSSGGHLRGLIDDILDLSAMETGSLRLALGDLDIIQICEEVCREGTAQAVGRDLTVRFDGPKRASSSRERTRQRAWGDERRTRQILSNLVSNAVKFTNTGEVVVSLRFADPFALVEVRDTGPGIAEADQGTVFELYGQVGDTSSRRKGSGLGLFIARKLAEAQGGSLELESRFGEGSTFRMAIPMVEPSTPVPAGAGFTPTPEPVVV
jgi:signal transduction histidine kinase